MGVSRSQAGGHHGGWGAGHRQDGGWLGRGSALSGGTCPSPGGQWHTPLSSALQGQAVKTGAGVWQDQNRASLLDPCLCAVSLLSVVLGLPEDSQWPRTGRGRLPGGG